MEGERAHQQGFSLIRETSDFPVVGDAVRDLRGFDDAGAVGAGRNPQRAVGGVAVVEMESDGEKRAQYRLGRSRVVNALFDGGEVESVGCYFSGERKHQVLVPGDFPVGGGGFVESDGLDGDRACREMAGGGEFVFERDGGLADCWMIEQTAFSGRSVPKKAVAESVESFSGDTGWNDAAAVVFEIHLPTARLNSSSVRHIFGSASISASRRMASSKPSSSSSNSGGNDWRMCEASVARSEAVSVMA